jgi:cytochrome c5
MSEDKTTKANTVEVITNFLMVFVLAFIAIVLIVGLVVSIYDSRIRADDPGMTDKAISERIRPVGQVEVAAVGASKAERSGEEVYRALCASCHDTGALGAPKLNAKGDWTARIAKGFDTLVKNAIGGINQMPPRGGGADLSDAEIASAVAYMANSAGANFKAPAPAAMGSAAPSAEAPSAKAADGKAVYEASCAACHGSGVAGAPKLGDKAAWAARVKSGADRLLASALKGKGAMPAKGGNASLTDVDVKAAVEFMVSKAK